MPNGHRYCRTRYSASLRDYAPVFGLLLMLLLAACDPMAPQATPVDVVISPLPSATATIRATNTPVAATRTPIPTPTLDVTPTSTPFPCDVEAGQVIAFDDFRSDTAGENLRYRVYVPPCYFETQARYPYVLLLHGLSFREQQWEDIGVVDAIDQGIRLGALPPMVLVMPYMGQIGTFNQFPPERSYETVILEELIPALETNFCLWEDREYRGIGGISRGAFWAYSIGFRHPDLFSRLGAHSGAFPTNLNEVPAAFNPLQIAVDSSFLPEANLRLYMDNAVSDPVGLEQQVLSNRLRENSIAHEYVINTVGGHNNDYWASHVTEYLSFYGDDWPRGYSGLPSCREPSP